MVFQNYALYPHMTVRQNMEFPLRLANVPDEEIRTKVEETAKILDLDEHLDRKPANLSGGQRQRVAMGRAIVRDPSAFLMDEPLSNLDAKLRVQMRTEVSRIQADLGTTTVYVTHDQTEAMTLGDRVAVMRAGVLQQVGSPAELYADPKNMFVAGFIGSPAMNFMAATLNDGRVKLPFGEIPLPDDLSAARARSGNVIVGIRPESFEDAHLVGDALDRGTTFRAKIDLVESMGSEQYAYFRLEGESLDSDELRELAEDAGTSEVPSSGEGQGRRPARRREQGEARRGVGALGGLDQAPPVRPRERAELEARDGSELAAQVSAHHVGERVLLAGGLAAQLLAKALEDLLVPAVGAQQVGNGGSTTRS